MDTREIVHTNTNTNKHIVIIHNHRLYNHTHTQNRNGIYHVILTIKLFIIGMFVLMVLALCPPRVSELTHFCTVGPV